MSTQTPADKQRAINQLTADMIRQDRDVSVVFYGSGLQTESTVRQLFQIDPLSMLAKLKRVWVVGTQRQNGEDIRRKYEHIFGNCRLNSRQTNVASKFYYRQEMPGCLEELVEDKANTDGDRESLHLLVMTADAGAPLPKRGEDTDEKIAYALQNVQVVDRMKEELGNYRPDHILFVTNLPEANMVRAAQVMGLDHRRFSGASGLDLKRAETVIKDLLRTHPEAKGYELELSDLVFLGIHIPEYALPVLLDLKLKAGTHETQHRDLKTSPAAKAQLLDSMRRALVADLARSWAYKKQTGAKGSPTDSGVPTAEALLALINDDHYNGNSMLYPLEGTPLGGIALQAPIMYRGGLAYLDGERLNKALELVGNEFRHVQEEVLSRVLKKSQLINEVGVPIPLKVEEEPHGKLVPGKREDFYYQPESMHRRRPYRGARQRFKEEPQEQEELEHLVTRSFIAATSSTPAQLVLINPMETKLRSIPLPLKSEKIKGARVSALLEPQKGSIISVEVSKDKVYILLSWEVDPEANSNVSHLYKLALLNKKSLQFEPISPVLLWEQQPIASKGRPSLAIQGDSPYIGFNIGRDYRICKVGMDGLLEEVGAAPSFSLDKLLFRGGQAFVTDGKRNIFTSYEGKVDRVFELFENQDFGQLIDQEYLLAIGQQGQLLLYWRHHTQPAQLMPSERGIYYLAESSDGVVLATLAAPQGESSHEEIHISNYGSVAELYENAQKPRHASVVTGFTRVKGIHLADDCVLYVANQRNGSGVTSFCAYSIASKKEISCTSILGVNPSTIRVIGDE